MLEPDDTFTLKGASFKWKRGRPRLSWAHEIFNISLRISGSLPALHDYLSRYHNYPRDWLAAIDSYI